MKVLHVYNTIRELKVAKRKFESGCADRLASSSSSESVMHDGTLHRWVTMQSGMRGTRWDMVIIDELGESEDSIPNKTHELGRNNG